MTNYEKEGGGVNLAIFFSYEKKKEKKITNSYFKEQIVIFSFVGKV